MPPQSQNPPANPSRPSTPSQGPGNRSSPPGAPQKAHTSPGQTTVSMPIRSSQAPPSSTQQPARPSTPIPHPSPANGSPSTTQPPRTSTSASQGPLVKGSPPKQPPRSSSPGLHGLPARSSPSAAKANASPPKPALAGSAALREAQAAHGTSPPRHSTPQRSEHARPSALLPAAPVHRSAESSALTIFQALSVPLPTFQRAADFKPGGKHESSKTVGDTLPPTYWTERDVGDYLATADAHLAKPGVKDYLDKHYAPSLEPTFRVRREADVVRYAAVHLVHAVNMALGGAIFPGGVETAAECQAGLSGMQLRPDSMWRAAKAKTPNGFAILELKTAGGMDLKRLDEGKRADENATNTFSENTMMNSIKQLTAYARNEVFNARYVALFDGQHLLLCIFSQDANKLPLMTGTLVPCHGTKGANARKALLGWLVEAKNQKEAKKNSSLGPGPAVVATQPVPPPVEPAQAAA